MSLNPPITDSDDPRVTHGDFCTAQAISNRLPLLAPQGTDHWSATSIAEVARLIAQSRISEVCRALGPHTEEYPRLSSLIWYHTDGQNHGWHAETWKEHAEELTKERDRLREDRENTLEALGMHPDSDSVDIAVEIRRIRDEGRALFHQLTALTQPRP